MVMKFTESVSMERRIKVETGINLLGRTITRDATDDDLVQLLRQDRGVWLRVKERVEAK